MLLNHVFYLITVTCLGGTKGSSKKRLCFKLKGKAVIIKKLTACSVFICSMKFYSTEKILSSKRSQIILMSVVELMWFML